MIKGRGKIRWRDEGCWRGVKFTKCATSTDEYEYWKGSVQGIIFTVSLNRSDGFYEASCEAGGLEYNSDKNDYVRPSDALNDAFEQAIDSLADTLSSLRTVKRRAIHKPVTKQEKQSWNWD